ncbi:RNA 2',3'-cyclic phosphodiesterase [Pseudoduganella chitinolytica]|uniref:RNA 2',3'-cyclic phosphodiesterase n=1 Tax=Pseudoduganella chitinolytica TaxID=34070 RepID=A0ABY8B653_9BURK|nr:RNA 2',3'-cyclic phosphodiesterase [Pseudoduganella chitinolytica]WEF31412.1 RNA 2',3'-cyclic phosphodiesterase [Pseudoduganella chitinolytica]
MIANHPDASTNEATRKLFFALWPDDAQRAALVALQAGMQGRLIPPAKLHITLAFLGHLPATAVPTLLAILHALPVPPLALSIDCYGYFARPRIAWAGMTQPPAALLDLQAELVRRLVAAGFSTATHGSFKPHVTLAREAREAPSGTFAPVPWHGARAVLVESLPGGEYVVVDL